MDERILDFLEGERIKDYSILPLTNDASDRRYFRLTRNNETYVLMDSSKSKGTFGDFLMVQKYLSNTGLSVPHVFSADIENGYALLEDFGDRTLDRYLAQNKGEFPRINDSTLELISAFSDLKNPPFPEFDDNFFFTELSKFTSWYFSFVGKLLNDDDVFEFEQSWKKPLKYLSENDSQRVFVHKDLHCGNLLLLPERHGVKALGIIDFQSAKSGSIAYDATSFFYDCRMPQPRNTREEMLENYAKRAELDLETFRTVCDIYIAQRNIKILGNFTHIHQTKSNSSYLKYLPHVWQFVKESLENPILKDVNAWLKQKGLHK